MKVKCQHCNGTGEVEHECTYQYSQHLKTLWDEGRRSWTICRCKACGQLWKIRSRYDPGTGGNYICLKPGESKRGYSFTEEEAREYRQEVAKDAGG